MANRPVDRTGLFLVVALLTLLPFNLGEVRGRARRSDDSDPLEAVVSRLTQSVEQLTSQVAAQDSYCKTQIGLLKSRVDATEQSVAFTAYFGHPADANVHGLGVGQTLKFDTPLINSGSAYNPATGIFTAPSAGTYVFFVHKYYQSGYMYACALIVHSFFPGADDEGPIEVDIYADSTRLLRVGACCKSMNSGSNMVTVHLTQGQAVHVQVVKGSMLLGGAHSSFSGYKLSPL